MLRGHISAMLPDLPLDAFTDSRTLATGTVLLRRGELPEYPLYLASGQVRLGVVNGNEIVHLLGLAQGPFWLDATEVILGVPHVMDVVADTDVVVNSVPAQRFQASLSALPATVRAMVRDIAKSHRQQSELAVSRLVKDAEARCAEWLLRSAEPSHQGGLAVMWREHKRMVAHQLGIAPETLSRILRHLREQQLVSGTGRVLRLLDPTRLRDLANAGMATG